MIARWRALPGAVRAIPAVVVLIVLVMLPYATTNLPFGLLPDRVNAPGSMQLLALCLTMAGIAVSYDVMFGRTGLLSFGHALPVAGGSYLLAIAMTSMDLPLLPAAVLAIVVSTLLSLIVGAIALRVKGIAFAMVTLAFAQAASILVLRDPNGLTGGEEGKTLNRAGMPDRLLGVANAPYRYWIALAFAVLAWGLVAWVVRSRAGHAMAAVRENEQRAAVLGFGTYAAKLQSIVVASFLGSVGGVVNAIVQGGSDPSITTAEFTLSMLVMVVIGGAGSRWGALLGGFLYTYADSRLVSLTGTSWLDSLPSTLGRVLSQPLFVLGIIFVAIVYVAPTGLTGLLRRSLSRD